MEDENNVIPYIFLPTEVWEDNLLWIYRPNLASGVSKVNILLNNLAYPLLHKDRPYKLHRMIFSAARKQLVIEKWHRGVLSLVAMPIPEVTVPENICGFNELLIQYLNAQVYTMLQHLHPLLWNIRVVLWSGSIADVFQLMSLIDEGVRQLDVFHQSFATIWENFGFYLKNLEMIYINDVTQKKELDAIRQFLTEFMDTNQPKLIEFRMDNPNIMLYDFIRSLREDFMNSMVISNEYSVRVQFLNMQNFGMFNPEEIINGRTGEKYRFMTSTHELIICRCHKEGLLLEYNLNDFFALFRRDNHMSTIKIDIK